MKFEILSIFPDVFKDYLGTSIMGKAQAKGIFSYTTHNLRNWTHDAHHSVDDAPFGGGQGMLMKCPPIFEAVRDIQTQDNIPAHVIFFSPVGVPYSQASARRLANTQQRILFVCGRYEGIDERAYELADEIISLGDYVLTGAELAAMTVIDSVVRLLPGALGDEMSAQDESFSQNLLEYAQYTRPAEYEGRTVPEVLLSGNHAEIAKWRANNALERTRRLRPDLLADTSMNKFEHDEATLKDW